MKRTNACRMMAGGIAVAMLTASCDAPALAQGQMLVLVPTENVGAAGTTSESAPSTTTDQSTSPSPADTTAPAVAVPTQPAPQTGDMGSGNNAVEESVPTEQPHNHHFRVGPEIGIYFPTRNLVKNRFGTTWYDVGLGFGQVSDVPTRGQGTLALSAISSNRSGNYAVLVPLGFAYRQGLADSHSFNPYVGAEGDAVFSDIRSVTDNVPAALRTTEGAAVYTGINLSRNTNIEVQYRFFSDIKGYNFSGTNLVAGYRF